MTDLTLLSLRCYPVWSLLCLLGNPVLAYEPVAEVPPDFKMPAPLSLEESVASLKARPGLRVELVAAEPLVMDPIHIDWGADGKLWVVEMADYPLGMDGKGKAGGRVRFLEDRDGDGKYDTSTEFLEGLNFPTGVKPWRDGVLVIACPEIFYAADTDGDGRADHREVLYRGFREGNQQHRVNGLEWGLDGWLEVANGDSGGIVKSTRTGEKLELGSFDLAIRPDTGEMRLLTGRTQYGRVRDDLGNWFGCNNSRPIFHFFLNDAWLRRNPHAIYPAGARDIEAGDDPRRVFPFSRSGQRYNDPHAENRFTSACGLAIYRDDRLGEGFRGNAFICEPVHQLVSRRVMEPNGISFRAVRAADEADSEFLASTDHWFRPTSARTGPDGALWVVDMHRFVIEHPEWIPAPWQKVLDLRAGHDQGRIYRVVSDRCDPSAVPERLADLQTPELVGRLSHRNGWTRDMVQQLLMERAVPTTDPAIREASANHPSPVTLAHLFGIFGEGRVPPALLLEALTDDSPAARRVALRAFRAASATPSLVDAVIEVARAPADAPTALAAAIALGQIETPEAGAALAEMMQIHGGDPGFTAGAISSVLPHVDAVAAALSRTPPELRSPLLPNLLETAIALERTNAVAHLLSVPEDDQTGAFTVSSTLLAVLDRRGIELSEFQEKAPGPLADALTLVKRQIERSRELADDTTASPAIRCAAIAMLGRQTSTRDGDIGRLLNGLGPATPAEVQTAAATRLIELGAFGKAIDYWNTFSPAVKARLIGGALSDRNQVAVMLTAIETGRLPVTALDAASRERLANHPHSPLRQQAKAILGAGASPDRAAVMAKYAPALHLAGDPVKGRAHFVTLCAACHRLDGVGRNLGADLAALADKSPGSLLTAILDPNRAVEDKYLLYQIHLKGGETLAGMILAEAGESLSLQLLDGTTREVLRGEVRGLTSTGRSAMPEGLEAALDTAALADLIRFLGQARM